MFEIVQPSSLPGLHPPGSAFTGRAHSAGPGSGEALEAGLAPKARPEASREAFWKDFGPFLLRFSSPRAFNFKGFRPHVFAICASSFPSLATQRLAKKTVVGGVGGAIVNLAMQRLANKGWSAVLAEP